MHWSQREFISRGKCLPYNSEEPDGVQLALQWLSGKKRLYCYTFYFDNVLCAFKGFIYYQY